MLAAALLLSMAPDLVPVRWPSADPASLDLLNGTVINCLWLEKPQWSPVFAQAAASRGITTFGVIRREGDPIAAARDVVKAGLNGAILEGEFDGYSSMIVGGTLAKAKLLFLESGSRSAMKLDAEVPILVTSQGMWPGIHVEKGSSATAGPTANPWIDTNTGFLRYVRAATEAVVWVAVEPPPSNVYLVNRYLQAIGDAAMNGGRWVVSLDGDLWKRILAREPKSVVAWSQITAALAHYEEHKEWRSARPAGSIAVVEDYEQARFSGGLFDMMAAKHVPAFSIPASKADAFALRGVKVAVNPEPTRATLPKSAAIVVDGPPPPNDPKPGNPNDFVFVSDDTRVNTTWQNTAAVIGRQNLGARLFNVASMLSNVVTLRGERQTVLHLVNYSDYPASGITARVPGVYRRARLYRPGEAPVDLEVERVDEGTGFAIDQRIISIATVVLE